MWNVETRPSGMHRQLNSSNSTFHIRNSTFSSHGLAGGLDNALQRGEIAGERITSAVGRRVRRVRLLADELFVALDVAGFLEFRQVNGEVAVGDVERLLQKAKVGLGLRYQGGHDAEPHLLVNNLVQRLNRVEQFRPLLHYFPCFLAITMP